MVCLYCGQQTRVTNSRAQRRLQAVWRRRHCTNCGATFTTQERADLSASVVFKDRDGVLKPFDGQTLFLSLYNSLRHRPQPQQDAAALTNTVISRLLPQAHGASLSRTQVVTAVAEVLKHFDKAAQVQYLAFHPLTKPA